MMNDIFFKIFNMEARWASGFGNHPFPPVGAAHQPGATNMEALRASGFGNHPFSPVGVAHQPGATNMEALRASKRTIYYECRYKERRRRSIFVAPG